MRLSLGPFFWWEPCGDQTAPYRVKIFLHITATVCYLLCHLSPLIICSLLWHGLHKEIRFMKSCVPPSASGFLWWTSSTGTRFPRLKHSSQKGCPSTYRFRILCHSRPYLFFVSLFLSYISYLLFSIRSCSSQNRPSVSFGHPGKEHGLFGFLGIALSPFGQKKSLYWISPAKARFIYFFLIIL